MRVGVNGRFYGAGVWGVQRFAREVGARLLDRPEVTVFLPGGVAAPGPHRADPRPARGEEPPALRRVAGRLRGHLWEQLELPGRARRAGCGVVLHLAGSGPLRGEPPGVVAIHDAFPLTDPQWYTRRFVLWHRAVVRQAARRAAAIVTCSQWSRGELAGALGVPAGRIHVVGQGAAPFDRPAPEEAVRRVRERRGLPSTYLLAAGGGDRRKNVDFLVRALALWEARTGDAPPLVVVGAREARVHGRGDEGRPAPPAPTRPRVHRLGYVDEAELHALYTGAAAFCFPSLAEGFGRPPLEAMACGTPAVAAPYGCAREVLGGAALLLPLEPEAWIEGLARLLGDEEARRERVGAGLAHVRGLSWDEPAEAVWRLCREAA